MPACCSTQAGRSPSPALDMRLCRRYRRAVVVVNGSVEASYSCVRLGPPPRSQPGAAVRGFFVGEPLDRTPGDTKRLDGRRGAKHRAACPLNRYLPRCNSDGSRRVLADLARGPRDPGTDGSDYHCTPEHADKRWSLPPLMGVGGLLVGATAYRMFVMFSVPCIRYSTHSFKPLIV